MKAVSLWQPHASLWVLQLKKNETRSWGFPDWYTGPVAIHAAKKKIKLCDIGEYYLEGILEGLNKAGLEFEDLPRGKFIGVCDSIASHRITYYQKDDLEDMLGDWTLGRYAWKPENMRPLPEPIPFVGRQRLFNVDDHIIFGGDPPAPGPSQMVFFLNAQEVVMGKRIPIKAAKDIAKQYGYDQVIIWAQNNEESIQHVTTFGRSVVDADQACQAGNYIKRELLGWPASKCLAEPTRVRNLRKRIKELEMKIEK